MPRNIEEILPTMNASLNDPIKRAGVMQGIYRDIVFLSRLPVEFMEQLIAAETAPAHNQKTQDTERAVIDAGANAEIIREITRINEEMRQGSLGAIRAAIEVQATIREALERNRVKAEL